MKFTISATLASAILATTVAADTSYNLRVSPVSGNPAIKDSLLSVRDESATTSPTPLGIWSTGEPRSAYTFTLVTNAANPQLFEMKNTVKSTHAILYGPDAAMALADVPIGADPLISSGQLVHTNTFTKFGDGGRILLAQRYSPGGDPNDLIGAGTWRACKGDSEVDYQIVWFDGLSDLGDYYKGCETVELFLQEAQTASSTATTAAGFITGVPAPTATTSGFITGVPAPVTTEAAFITGVPAPSFMKKFRA